MINLQELFPLIDNTKEQELLNFIELVKDWNTKINLISRKDIDNLVAHHLIPSLAISLACPFAASSTILDVGTGGGFPGLPLSICFPKAQFSLIDSILKKVTTVQNMADSLNLKNVRTKQIRVEEFHKKFDFVIGRSVTALPTLLSWIAKNLNPGNNSPIPNGLLYIKGNDYETELKNTNITPTQVFSLADYFNGEFCQDKFLLHFSTQSISHLAK